MAMIHQNARNVNPPGSQGDLEMDQAWAESLGTWLMSLSGRARAQDKPILGQCLADACVPLLAYAFRAQEWAGGE